MYICVPKGGISLTICMTPLLVYIICNKVGNLHRELSCESLCNILLIIQVFSLFIFLFLTHFLCYLSTHIIMFVLHWSNLILVAHPWLDGSCADNIRTYQSPWVWFRKFSHESLWIVAPWLVLVLVGFFSHNVSDTSPILFEITYESHLYLSSMHAWNYFTNIGSRCIRNITKSCNIGYYTTIITSSSRTIQL